MSPQHQTTAGVAVTATWQIDVIFKLFADPVRRKLLLTLARQPWQTPSELKDKAECTLDAVIKRLDSMRSEGFVVLKSDNVDKRRRLCSLASAVSVTTTEKGKVLDFGFL